MSTHYILDGKTPVPADIMTWAQWFSTNGDGRTVAKTEVGGMLVSTVFLGLDHNWGDGPPPLFETMIFGGPLDQEYQERCSTWEQAEAMHLEGINTAKRMLA